MAFSRECVAKGVDGLIVDFETRGKAVRQNGFDTEINHHTLADLEAVRTLRGAHLMCRINGPGPGTCDEIADVLRAGADEVIVPMIRSLDEARTVVEAVSGAARITIMVETVEALGIVPALCNLPIHRIYVGLNDLHISQKSATLFAPLIDGSLDRIRADVDGVQFGFGGLTLLGRGDPLPVHHLVGGLARLKADFTFLRRSFYRDVAGQNPKDAMDQMRTAVSAARARDATETQAAFDALKSAVYALEMA